MTAGKVPFMKNTTPHRHNTQSMDVMLNTVINFDSFIVVSVFKDGAFMSSLSEGVASFSSESFHFFEVQSVFLYLIAIETAFLGFYPIIVGKLPIIS